MADYALQARDMGINFIGACRGTVAMHIREMARDPEQASGRLAHLEKRWRETNVGVRILRPRQARNGQQEIDSVQMDRMGPVLRGARTFCGMKNTNQLFAREALPRAPAVHQPDARSRTKPGVRWRAEHH